VIGFLSRLYFQAAPPTAADKTQKLH